MKIVINSCYGGFGLSEKAVELYVEKSGNVNFDEYDVKRNDPILVAVVEVLGTDASGGCATLKVVEIPDGVVWGIEDYDGIEWVSEFHRTWR